MLFFRMSLPRRRNNFPETIEISSTVHSPAQRILELDGLRGIAIAMVLMRHYIHHPSLLLLGPQWGWMGVNLFFVLSGFLITSILLRLTDQRGALKIFYAAALTSAVSSLLSCVARVLRSFRLRGHAATFENRIAVHQFLAGIHSAPVHTPEDRAASGLGGDGVRCAVVVVGGRVLLYSLGSAGHVHSRATRTSAYILALILLLTPWARYLLSRTRKAVRNYSSRRWIHSPPDAWSRSFGGTTATLGEPACSGMRAGCMDALRR